MKAFVLYSKNISCGCMKNINTSLDPNRRKDSPEWRAWRDMKDRCYNPNKKEYFRYGGRGIKVCDRWLNNYDNFYSDMGKRPNKGLSIDRIDVDGNYEPSNCKWSTAKEQANNTRRNIAYKMKNKIGEYGTV
ncbi:MAG: hypothetical protein EOO20_08845 [Chryseobacterium sp.]|nr:MAG: hypothetical protein EOO20_08845 [Chryseobacterium sp.]